MTSDELNNIFLPRVFKSKVFKPELYCLYKSIRKLSVTEKKKKKVIIFPTFENCDSPTNSAIKMDFYMIMECFSFYLLRVRLCAIFFFFFLTPEK